MTLEAGKKNLVHLEWKRANEEAAGLLPTGAVFNQQIKSFIDNENRIVNVIKFVCSSAETSPYQLNGGGGYILYKGTDIEIHTSATEFIANNNCKGMFDKLPCTSIDLTGVNTQHVTNMREMFQDCIDVTLINLSNINTQNVTDMRLMFSGCKNITSLDLTKLNTQNVIDMSYMFHKCEKLTSLDLSNFNTQYVRFMGNMFYNCKALSSLNLSNFNTERVTNMYYMFYDVGIEATSKPIPIYVSTEGQSFITNYTVNGLDSAQATLVIKDN